MSTHTTLITTPNNKSEISTRNDPRDISFVWLYEQERVQVLDGVPSCPQSVYFSFYDWNNDYVQ